MTHSERFQLLHARMNQKHLDPSYRAALYILSSNDWFTTLAIPHISSEGVDFTGILDSRLDERERVLLEFTHNLFSWRTVSPPSPHEVAQLGVEYLDLAVQALYLASGLHTMESGVDWELRVNRARHEKAKRAHLFLDNLAFSVASSGEA